MTGPPVPRGGAGSSPYASAAASAARLAERTGQAGHDVAVVLGSGWSPAAQRWPAGWGRP